MPLHRIPALAALTLLLAAASASAAGRPPIPAGGKQIAAGHVPGACTSAADDGQGPNFGYYYSTRSKAWISAPRCVPKWGNLALMPSQIVRAGGRVTMTAVPDGGSNSGQYAPETKSISWQFPGKRVSGCGKADLSCTAEPFRKAAKEWQWGLFHVSMPRTFFVDSPGSNCAGIHLCAGFSTNAWAFGGVPPKGQEPPAKIRGRVQSSVCGENGCDLSPLPGVEVTAKGPDDGSATTGADGRYSITVDKGRYTVTPKLGETDFTPPSADVKIAKKDVDNIDFRACSAEVETTRLVPLGAPALTREAKDTSLCGSPKLTLKPATDVKLPALILAKGTNFKPHELVKVYVARRDEKEPVLNRTSRADANGAFTDLISIKQWARRAKPPHVQDGCAEQIEARQTVDGRTLTAKATARGSALGHVVWEEGYDQVKTGEAYCTGESPQATIGEQFCLGCVLITQPIENNGPAELQPLIIRDSPTDVLASFGVGGAVCLRTQMGGSWVRMAAAAQRLGVRGGPCPQMQASAGGAAAVSAYRPHTGAEFAVPSCLPLYGALLAATNTAQGSNPNPGLAHSSIVTGSLNCGESLTPRAVIPGAPFATTLYVAGDLTLNVPVVVLGYLYVSGSVNFDRGLSGGHVPSMLVGGNVNLDSGPLRGLSKAEKDELLEAAAPTGPRGSGLQHAGFVLTLAGFLIPATGVVSGTVKLASIALGATGESNQVLSDYFNFLARDPRDAHFAKVAVPKAKAVALHVGTKDGFTATAAGAVNALLSNSAQSVAYGKATTTAFNRASTAAEHHKMSLARTQLRAAGRYAARLASLLDRRRALMAQAAKALRGTPAGDYRLTADQSAQVNAQIAQGGLPQAFVDVAHRAGAGDADLAATAALAASLPPDLSPPSIADVFNDPGEQTTLRRAAKALRSFSRHPTKQITTAKKKRPKRRGSHKRAMH